MTADRADFGGRSEDPCDSLSSCSDEELVERCRGGRLSVPAASELIYRYFGFIKSKAASMCGSASVCDDFVQEGVLGSSAPYATTAAIRAQRFHHMPIPAWSTV